jgi:hypothetical protein
MRVLAGKWTMATAERRMSWSSGASSGHDFRGTIGRRGTETRSPVVYRENRMAYELEKEKLCDCNPRRKDAEPKNTFHILMTIELALAI